MKMIDIKVMSNKNNELNADSFYEYFDNVHDCTDIIYFKTAYILGSFSCSWWHNSLYSG